MSISLGGMGIVSLRNPFADFILGKGDLRSMFCLIVFLIVFFVLGSFSALFSLVILQILMPIQPI
jgi:hypothetical protein